MEAIGLSEDQSQSSAIVGKLNSIAKLDSPILAGFTPSTEKVVRMASLNAGPEYYTAEERYRSAKTIEDKKLALEDMLRLCPKHKAAESVLMEIKSKLAKTRKLQESAKKSGRKSGTGDAIRKQGAGQVLLLGFPNSGKSYWLNQLTNTSVQSTLAPFETNKSTPGMMLYKKVQVQIVDTPSAFEGNKPRLYALARVADLTIVLIDPQQNVEEQKEFFADVPAQKKILLENNSKKTEEVKEMIYSSLDLIRVYTKNPNTGKVEEIPIALKKDSTVRDAAKEIHKELAETVKYAKVWGSSKFPGQQAGMDYVLKDEDVVELHER
ncbi:TGS domain-containing protein [Candidatus Micrarchaeota archaeon]|nr:TGS domain-containing protein [Candidatus Micrarchaeota archaeon]